MTMKHIHHIIPRHMGGTDDPENLTELSVEEHAEAHRVLFETHGKKEDYIAWKCLLGVMEVEEKVAALAALGGKITGAKHKDSGHIARLGKEMPLDERLCYIKKGIEIQRTAQSGCFFNPELRRVSCSKGGIAQGRKNAESGHLGMIARSYWNDVRAGKRPRQKKFWITNGEDEMTIPTGSDIPEGYHRGRKSGIGRRRK